MQLTSSQKLYLYSLIAYSLCLATGYLFSHLWGIATNVPIGSTPPAPASTSNYSLIEFIFALVGTLVISVVVIMWIGKYIFRYYAYALLAFATLLFFSVFIATFIPDMSISIFIGILIIFMILYWLLHDQYFNFYSIFVAGVLGAYTGFVFPPLYLFFAYIVLVVYDILAVLKSNVMLSIVKTTINSNHIPPLFIYTGKISDLKTLINKRRKVSIKSKNSGARLLGTGDIIFPGAFAVTIALYYGPLIGITLILAALAGLYLNYRIVNERHVALPALPLLFTCQAVILLLFLTSINFINILVVIFIIYFAYSGIDSLAELKAKKR